MAVYQRGDTYWYKFNFNGQHSEKRADLEQGSGQANRGGASRALGERRCGYRRAASGSRVQGIRSAVHQGDRDAVCFEAANRGFYKRKLRALLKYEPIASTPLDLIDEAAIQAFQTGSPPSRIPPQEAFVRSQREPRAGHFAPPAASGAGVEGLRESRRLTKPDFF
jgi:hypothetical protein